MGIIQLPYQLIGQDGVKPNRRPMVVTDNLATITAPNYLNANNLQGVPISNSDVVEVFYLYNTTTGASNYAVFTVTVSATGIITLNEISNPGDVLLPVISGHFASFNGTSGQIYDAGYSPTSFVQLSGSNQMAAGSSVYLNKGTGNEFGNAVIVNAQAGVITTSSLTTTAGNSYSISLTNTFISTNSVVLLSYMGGTNTTRNIVMSISAGNGVSLLSISNISPATAFNGTILIGFAVF